MCVGKKLGSDTAVCSNRSSMITYSWASMQPQFLSPHKEVKGVTLKIKWDIVIKAPMQFLTTQDMQIKYIFGIK